MTRKHGIGAVTYYHWKSKYAEASVPELKRLGKLEAAEREVEARRGNDSLELSI